MTDLYPLRGIVKCSKCGNYVTSHKNTNKRYYRCLTYANNKTCTAKTIPAKLLETQIKEELINNIRYECIENEIKHTQNNPDIKNVTREDLEQKEIYVFSGTFENYKNNSDGKHLIESIASLNNEISLVESNYLKNQILKIKQEIIEFYRYWYANYFFHITSNPEEIKHDWGHDFIGNIEEFFENCKNYDFIKILNMKYQSIEVNFDTREVHFIKNKGL